MCGTPCNEAPARKCGSSVPVLCAMVIPEQSQRDDVFAANAPFISVADDFPVMSGAARRSLHARLKKRNRGAGAR